MGSSHSCGLTIAGAIECWGSNDADQTSVPTGSFTHVSAGGFHSCGLTSSGAVECWGGMIVRLSGLSTRASAPSLPAAPITARIAARRHADGRIEFALRPEGGSWVFPKARLLPANPTVDRWLNSSVVIVNTETLGRISARRRPDGSTEFGFLPPDSGDRVLPSSRYLPAGAATGWLRSTTFEITPPGG